MRKLFGTLAVALAVCVSLANAAAPRYADQWEDTTGEGTAEDPYVKWESALAADTEIIFNKGFYESPATAISVPSGSVLRGVDGAILQWPSSHNSSEPILSLPAGTSNVVIDGLQFEAGVPVPADGVSGQVHGSSYIRLGTSGSSSTVARVRIQHCRFGLARYPTYENGGGYQIFVISSVDDFMMQNNTFDAATHNIIFFPGHSSQQYYYRNVMFHNNLVSFSQTRYWFGRVFGVGVDPATVPAKVEQVSIVGNHVRNANGVFGVGLGGQDVLIASNNVYSDNLDEYIGVAAPSGQTLSGVVVSNNVCYGTDPTGDPNKIFEPTCRMQLARVTNATIVGNSSRAPSAGTSIDVMGTNIRVADNLMDVMDTASGTGGACYVARKLAYASFSNNTCLNTGGAAFVIEGDTGEVHDLEFVNNVLWTTTSSAIAQNFFDFNVSATDVTIRENRVFGKNFASGGSFNNGFITRLNSVGNQESIQETGWRIGSDQVTDITGAGLEMSSGSLGVNTGAGLHISSGEVAVNTGGGLQISSGAVAVNTGGGLQISSGAVAVNPGAGLQISSGAVAVNPGTGLEVASGALRVNSTVATLTGAQVLTHKDLTASTNIFRPTAIIGATFASPSSTTYCGPSTGYCSTLESAAALPLPQLTLDNLYCKSTVAPGSGNSWDVALRVDGLPADLGCSISGTDTQCGSLDTYGVPLGSLVSLQLQRSGTPSTSASIKCVLWARP